MGFAMNVKERIYAGNSLNNKGKTREKGKDGKADRRLVSLYIIILTHLTCTSYDNVYKIMIFGDRHKVI